MIAVQSTCAIHNGSATALGFSGAARWPSRISRTVRREHLNARAISRTPRPDSSSRSISLYRSTVNFLRDIAPPARGYPRTVQTPQPCKPHWVQASRATAGGPNPRKSLRSCLSSQGMFIEILPMGTMTKRRFEQIGEEKTASLYTTFLDADLQSSHPGQNKSRALCPHSGVDVTMER